MLKGEVERLHIGIRAGAFANVSMFTRCSEAAGAAEWAHCWAAQRSDQGITQASLVAELLCVSPVLSCCTLPEAVCLCSAHKMGFPRNSSLVALQQATCPVQGLLYSLQPDRLISSEQLPPSQLGSESSLLLPSTSPPCSTGLQATGVILLAGCHIPHMPHAQGPVIFLLKAGLALQTSCSQSGKELTSNSTIAP